MIVSYHTSFAMGIFIVALTILSQRVIAFSPKSTVFSYQRETVSVRSTRSSEEENDERQKLLDKAQQLRDEVRNLEEKVRGAKSESSSSQISSTKRRPTVTDLKDSTWTISYRFSSQPKDDDKEDILLPNYSGKVTLRLKADGYSEFISSGNDTLQIAKIWGWDEEYSQEDQKQYLLLSMDVLFPKSDPKFPDGKERFYFQARIDRGSTDGDIALKDGTITVKKDVSEKTKGMWGLFQVAGILSQFRYVGEFVAKPS